MQDTLNFLPHAERLAQLDPALDYSFESLATLDCFLSCLRQGLLEKQVSPDQMHWLIVGAGSYFAEVLRRAVGAQWVNSSEQEEPWLETPSGPAFPFRLVRGALLKEVQNGLVLAAAEYGNRDFAWESEDSR